MDDIQQLRVVRWERIRQGGFWRFVLLRGVLGWGLIMGVIGIIFELVFSKIEKIETLPWYLTLVLFLIGGFIWGIATWSLSNRWYSRTPKS